MNSETNVILKKAIERFGLGILKEPKRFSAVLSDWNVSKKEINMLACVLKVSFFSDFLMGDRQDQALTNQLVREVQKEYPYSDLQILNAIRLFDYAIGRGVKTEKPKDEPTYKEKPIAEKPMDDPPVPNQMPEPEKPINRFQIKYKEGLDQYMKHAKKPENADAYKGQASVVIKDAENFAELQEAFSICQEAAARGDSISQNNLGVMFQEGIGITKDFKEAAKWYALAAEAGNMHAQQNLGWMYRNGFGVPQDCNKAMHYYTKAAAQGHLLAHNNIGWLYQNGYGTKIDYPRAFISYRIGAEQGEPYAQTNLGFMYEKGLGVEKDFFEAVKWYRLAADQKNEQAYNNLGYMYERGFGVITNFEESANFYRKAAEAGFIIGQINIARSYSIGLGVKKNSSLMEKWVDLYSKASDVLAIRIGAWCFANGCGVHTSIDEAIRWYTVAAELNDADSQYNLGLLYNKKEKPANASKWLQRASYLGNADAKELLMDVRG